MMSWRLAAALIVAIVALLQLHALDIAISDYAYDFDSSTWLVDHTNGKWRYLFYDGPKALLVLFALVLIALAAGSLSRLSRYINRREAIFLFLCLAVVPGVIGTIKHNSGVSCPYAIQRYGGDAPDSFGRLHINYHQAGDSVVGCWPSGHASGGFALLALAFLPRTRRVRVTLAVSILVAGGLMGTYQVLRGAHFTSHILVTLCMSWLLIGAISSVFPPGGHSQKPGDEYTVYSRILNWRRPV